MVGSNVEMNVDGFDAEVTTPDEEKPEVHSDEGSKRFLLFAIVGLGAIAFVLHGYFTEPEPDGRIAAFAAATVTNNSIPISEREVTFYILPSEHEGSGDEILSLIDETSLWGNGEGKAPKTELLAWSSKRFLDASEVLEINEFPYVFAMCLKGMVFPLEGQVSAESLQDTYLSALNCCESMGGAGSSGCEHDSGDCC